MNGNCVHVDSDALCDDEDPRTDDSCAVGYCYHTDKCPGQNCCSDGPCCSELCNQCLNFGSLHGGTIRVSPPVVCVGDTITFTISGVWDTGGTRRKNCAVVPIPAAVSFTWVITKLDGTKVNGYDASASVIADKAGTYSCTFTARAARAHPSTNRRCIMT